MSTPWQRIIDLYLDADEYGRYPVLGSRTGTDVYPLQSMSWVQDDKFTLRLWFRRKVSALGAPTISLNLGEGWNLVFEGKKKSDPDADESLFDAGAFTEVNEGDETYYQAVLDLRTDEMEAAFAALPAADPLEVLIDIEVQDSGNAQRITLQIPLTVLRQAYKGTESSPTPATPLYPAPNDLVLRAPVNGTYRFTSSGGSNYLQLWNATTAKYHTVWLTGDEGAVAMAFGPGED